MNEPSGVDAGLARGLILDEMFDLTLYRELHEATDGDLKKILGELVPVETRHLAFWQDFFNMRLSRLDFGRRFKLWLLVWVCRVFGPTAVHMVLEAIEIYGVRKYLAIWEKYQGAPLGQAVREILKDEFEHEDAIVSQFSSRQIDPEKVRGIFLGFNDGLVEMLGAVSGFFAAFSHASSVLMASSTVAVAGALSMAAGAFVAASSEGEMSQIEKGKARFSGAPPPEGGGERPVRSALIVGVSYFFGAMVPVLPVLLGARTVLASLLSAGLMIALVSLILAFLSGMAIRKRILLNLAILAAAVAVTYGVGILTRRLWGVAL